MLQIVTMRLVACHVLGASFWLPVPRVKCACCPEQWELPAAAAGFFPNAPVQAGVWFSTQLLDMYTPMFQSGLSATALADALSRVAAHTDIYVPLLPKLVGALLPIDDRWVPQTMCSASCASSACESGLAPESAFSRCLNPV
jgi:hypothetical protein